ncbi:MAG: response regulator [Endomicrobiales bacterium]
MGANEKKILVIDDEPGIRDLFSFEFAAKGYCVATAADGRAGLEAAKKSNFPVVICDVKMPGGDGIQLIEDIKKINPDTEVIILTAYGSIDTAVSAIKKGAYDFVQKPVNMGEVASLVEKAMEKVELKTMVSLYENSNVLFSTLRLDDLFPVLLELSLKILKADDITVLLPDAEGRFSVAAEQGLKNEEEKALRVRLAAGALSPAATWADVAVTGPVGEESPREARPVRSALLCPLVSKGTMLGVLCAARTGNDVPFDAADRHRAAVFASEISQAIRNAQLYHELEERIRELSATCNRLSGEQGEQPGDYAAVGKLFAGVSHRLKNALSIIMGLSELLIEGGNQTEEVLKDLRSIREQAEQTCTLVSSITRSAKKPK